MPQSSASSQGNFSGPHPLAQRLLDELPPGGVVLEIGPGSGRNTRALRDAGVEVMPVAPTVAEFATLGSRAFDAVLSTHALLHGTPASIEAMLARCVASMNAGAKLYATFGSTRDARFGTGQRISAHAFAPLDGDEAGIAHSYFNSDDVRELLRPLRVVELTEVCVDDVAGRWAHTNAPLSNAYHWFAVAEKPALLRG